MREDTRQDAAKKEHTIRDQTIAGVVVLAIGGVATWFFGILASAKVPIGWYFVGVAAVGLVATFVYPPWRKAIWGNVAKWRPFTTQNTLQRARDAGRSELEAELEAQRSRPLIRAQWLIGRDDAEQFGWKILNVADDSVAKHVSVQVDSRMFRPGSALDWESIHGGESGTFKGVLTDNARRGLDFSVSWVNANDVWDTALVSAT